MKKEYTDLTLRFPSRNAQIKVHKAVVNACSDYFVKAETNGLIEEGGILDMPDIFLPELVSPAIRFMYTGRLELKNHNVVKLKETANALGEYLFRVQSFTYFFDDQSPSRQNQCLLS